MRIHYSNIKSVFYLQNILKYCCNCIKIILHHATLLKSYSMQSTTHYLYFNIIFETLHCNIQCCNVIANIAVNIGVE